MQVLADQADKDANPVIESVEKKRQAAANGQAAIERLRQQESQEAEARVSFCRICCKQVHALLALSLSYSRYLASVLQVSTMVRTHDILALVIDPDT